MKEFRRDLLTRALALVQSVPASADPSEKRPKEKIARDLVDLYSGDPVNEFADIAKQAKKKLAELKPP